MFLDAYRQNTSILSMADHVTRVDFVDVLTLVWQEVLGRPVGLDDDFFALGGTSIQAAMIINRVQDRVGTLLHPAAMFDAPTITALTEWTLEHHPEVFGAPASAIAASSEGGLTEADIERARRHFARPDLAIDRSAHRNRPTIFILCPPRSGSTLLRVMLGGHPALFCPPELYLLGFDTLADRRTHFSGRLGFMGEGLVRAVMALRNVDHTSAEAIVESLVNEGASTHRVYALLHEWAGERRLVDKTPAYSLDPMALRRAEAEFEGAFFIHLVRHPMACVASFAEVRADLATGELSDLLPRSASKRGELWWLIGQSNTVDFLREIPPERQHQIDFESLVTTPEATMRTLCDRLGLAFTGEMLDPHADRKARMTDGTTEHSRMLGDQKFHNFSEIDPGRAEHWRTTVGEGVLCDQTWTLAESLGYARPTVAAPREEWEI